MELDTSRAYAAALAYAHSRPRAVREVAINAATDAILWAARHYRPGPTTFEAFAAKIVRQRVRQRENNELDKLSRRPAVSGLTGEETARHSDPPAGGYFEGLPDDLRRLCGLVFVEGYTYEEAGEILGLCRQVVSDRLAEAARIIRSAAD